MHEVCGEGVKLLSGRQCSAGKISAPCCSLSWIPSPPLPHLISSMVSFSRAPERPAISVLSTRTKASPESAAAAALCAPGAARLTPLAPDVREQTNKQHCCAIEQDEEQERRCLTNGPHEQRKHRC